MPKDDEFALFGFEGVDGLIQEAELFVGDHIGLVRTGCGILRELLVVVLSTTLGSEGGFGFETGGAKEPGRQGRVAADFLGFASENDEDVLGDFLCELGIEGSSVNAAVDLSLIHI